MEFVPERPISVSIISSQQANTGSPITAATVAIVGYMTIFEKSKSGNNYAGSNSGSTDRSVDCSIVCIQESLELEDDPEYQQRVADGLVKDFKKKVEGENR